MVGGIDGDDDVLGGGAAAVVIDRDGVGFNECLAWGEVRDEIVEDLEAPVDGAGAVGFESVASVGVKTPT
jgi:hypothetical protein